MLTISNTIKLQEKNLYLCKIFYKFKNNILYYIILYYIILYYII